MFWWMIGFEDLSKPAGQRFVGSIIIQHAGGFEAAAAYAIEEVGAEELLTCEAMGGHMDPARGAPPERFVGRLLGRAEAEQAAKIWGGGVASQEQIREAILSDDGGPQEAGSIFRNGR